MSDPALTIERIYPLQLDPSDSDDQNTLQIHVQRYAFAAERLQGTQVLDMACGCGYGSFLLAERNPDKHILGVDIDPSAIAYAQAHYQLPNLRYQCANAELFSHEIAFDNIVSLETIEHLPNPQALIANCMRLLARDGQIIASVPTTPTVDGNPHHLHDFTPRSFRALFSVHGLQAQECLEQVQWWQFQGLFKRRAVKQHRSEGVGNAVLAYYRQHPLYLFKRVASMLRYGFSNRYQTCRFSRQA